MSVSYSNICCSVCNYSGFIWVPTYISDVVTYEVQFRSLTSHALKYSNRTRIIYINNNKAQWIILGLMQVNVTVEAISKLRRCQWVAKGCT